MTHRASSAHARASSWRRRRRRSGPGPEGAVVRRSRAVVLAGRGRPRWPPRSRCSAAAGRARAASSGRGGPPRTSAPRARRGRRARPPRLAARLTARGLPSTARGRLAWLPLSAEPVAAAARHGAPPASRGAARHRARRARAGRARRPAARAGPRVVAATPARRSHAPRSPASPTPASPRRRARRSAAAVRACSPWRASPAPRTRPPEPARGARGDGPRSPAPTRSERGAERRARSASRRARAGLGAARRRRSRRCWSACSSSAPWRAAWRARPRRSGRPTWPRWPARGRCTTPYPRLFEPRGDRRPPEPAAPRRGPRTSRSARDAAERVARAQRRRATPRSRSPTGERSRRSGSASRRARSSRSRRGEERRAAPIEVAAEAELAPRWLRTSPAGGGYDGPLAYRQGKPMRPDVALAFDRMARGRARGRRDAAGHQRATAPTPSRRCCSRRHPDPQWVAPPGTSLHRNGTELDLGPPGGVRLAGRQRRALPLHPALPARALALRLHAQPALARRARRGRRRRRARAARCRPSCPRASRRCSPARPSAGTCRRRCSPPRSTPRATSTRSRRSPAGAQGIAQFMPATAEAMGLDDPFDAGAGDRSPGAPDARPAAPLRAPFRSPSPPTTPGRVRSRAACASRRTRRRAATSPGSSGCCGGPASWPPARGWRCGSCGDVDAGEHQRLALREPAGCASWKAERSRGRNPTCRRPRGY